MSTQECKNCKRRYKLLTEEELCYYCHTNKYGEAPTKKGMPWYAGEDRKAMKLGRSGKKGK